jgi:hypothetical protein
MPRVSWDGTGGLTRTARKRYPWLLRAVFRLFLLLRKNRRFLWKSKQINRKVGWMKWKGKMSAVQTSFDLKRFQTTTKAFQIETRDPTLLFLKLYIDVRPVGKSQNEHRLQVQWPLYATCDSVWQNRPAKSPLEATINHTTGYFYKEAV